MIRVRQRKEKANTCIERREPDQLIGFEKKGKTEGTLGRSVKRSGLLRLDE